MTWTLLDDSYMDYDEWERVSYAAMVLHIAGLVYCNRVLSDGVLPRRKAARLAPIQPEHFDGALAELVAEGVWAERDGDTLEIVGWVDDHQQKLRADVLAEREQTRNRKRAWRAKQGSAGGSSSPRQPPNKPSRQPETPETDGSSGWFDAPSGCVVFD